MPDVPITFDDATDAIVEADCVLLRDGRGNDFTATFRGYEEEGEDDSAFLVEACNGELRVKLAPSNDFIGVRNGHRLHIRGQGEIRLYREMT